MVRRNKHRLMRLVMVSICALVMCIAALTTVGCADVDEGGGAGQSTEATARGSVTVIDSVGREVVVAQPVERIVSLAPANTETLFELGLGDKVVGVTTYDNYPAQVETITKAGDFISPNFEVIASLNPDLILATGGVQGETIAALEQTGAPVLVIDPMSVDEILASFTLIGKATGTDEQAVALIERITEEIASIKSEVKKAQPDGAAVPSFIEIGQNPLFTVGSGTLLDEMLAIAGGANVVVESGFVPYSDEQVIDVNPTAYFATGDGILTVQDIVSREGYRDITAIREGRVIILDQDLVSRPGPRFVEGIQSLFEGLFGQPTPATSP